MPSGAPTTGHVEGLHDVTFSVAPGEFFGVVGRNGSGKSTLLKVIGGIIDPTEGTVMRRGRLADAARAWCWLQSRSVRARQRLPQCGHPWSVDGGDGLGIREHPGSSPRSATSRTLKLKIYSSGMYVRLAFAVAIQIDPDVLLIDEVLAVGDDAFQRKCYRQVRAYAARRDARSCSSPTTWSAVNRFCDRALLLERGRVVSMGIPHEVSGEYLAVNFRHERKVDATEAIDPLRDRAAFIAEAWFEDERGERVEYLTQGRSVRLPGAGGDQLGASGPDLRARRSRARAARASSRPRARGWASETGSFVGRRAGRLLGRVRQPARAGALLPLAPGHDPDRPARPACVDRRDRAAATVVTGTDDEGGLVSIPHDFTLERISARELSA